MNKLAILLFTVLFCCANAAELFIDPAGGRSSSGRFTITQGGIQTGKPSTVDIDYDGKNLHITLTSQRFPGWKAESKGKGADDTAMFGAETAEVFLMPANSKDYYQLALNPDGHLYSARRRDKTWNPKIKTVSKVLPDRWIATFSIPLAELGAEIPEEGTVWRANFALFVYDGEIRKQATWSSTTSFHNVDMFGKLLFTRKKFTGIKSCSLENDVMHVEFSHPANCTSRCIVAGVPHETGEGKVSVKLNSKEIGPKNFVSVTMQISDKDKTIFSETHSVPFKVEGSLALDRFYVTADREVNFEQKLVSPVTLQVHQGKKLLTEIKNAPAAGKLVLKNAANGKVTVTASGKNGNFARRVLIIRDNGIVAPPLPQGKITLDGRIMRKGGKPVFFVGTTGSTSWHMLHKQAFSLDLGTVSIMRDGLPLRPLPIHRLIRDPRGVGYLWKKDWQQHLHRVVTTSPDNRLHRICYEVQMGTYLHKDGKTIKVNTAEFVKDVYQYVKKKYPGKFFTQQCDRIEELHLFADHCDVLGTASWHSSYAENLLPNLSRDMLHVRKTAKNKPVIFWLGISVPHRESRCAEELRAGVYSAVLHDMAGTIFHLGHGGISAGKSRIWSMLSGINSEISEWYPSYADGEKLDDFILSSNKNLIVRAWKYRGKIFIGVVNTSPTEQPLDIRHRQGELNGTLPGYDAEIFSFTAK